MLCPYASNVSKKGLERDLEITVQTPADCGWHRNYAGGGVYDAAFFCAYREEAGLADPRPGIGSHPAAKCFRTDICGDMGNGFVHHVAGGL